MAERRMFAKAIVLSDAFLDMPMSARCLYFTLAMLADDDGFINSPKSIMRQCGATTDDMNILIAKRFVLTFESGVVVIKHWRIHNLIQKDRYRETKYLEEKSTLMLDGNKAYTECIQDVSIPEPQVRLGKDRLGEVRVGEDRVGEDRVGEDRIVDEDINVPTKPSKRFIPPTVDEVRAYCQDRQNGVDPQRFVDYYSSNGRMVGKNKMKDWKAAVRTWEHKENRGKPRVTQGNNPFLGMAFPDYEGGESL